MNIEKRGNYYMLTLQDVNGIKSMAFLTQDQVKKLELVCWGALLDEAVPAPLAVSFGKCQDCKGKRKIEGQPCPDCERVGRVLFVEDVQSPPWNEYLTDATGNVYPLDAGEKVDGEWKMKVTGIALTKLTAYELAEEHESH